MVSNSVSANGWSAFCVPGFMVLMVSCIFPTSCARFTRTRRITIPFDVLRPARQLSGQITDNSTSYFSPGKQSSCNFLSGTSQPLSTIKILKGLDPIREGMTTLAKNAVDSSVPGSFPLYSTRPPEKKTHQPSFIFRFHCCCDFKRRPHEQA